MVAMPHPDAPEGKPESESQAEARAEARAEVRRRRKAIVRKLDDKLAVTERIDELGKKLKAVGEAAGQAASQASDKPREFASVEHLSAEAIAAFVDDELSAGAMNRARIHIVHCAECRAEVNEHRAAADRLRRASEEEITAPSSLLNRLASIAENCPEDQEPKSEEAPNKPISGRAEVFYRAVKKIQRKRD